MRAKLIKTENGYGLEGVEIIAFYSSKRPVHNHYKLSKQNCDEIFGVVDVKKMGWEYYQNNGFDFHSDIAFVAGFNKAMELNKDKVFTVEEMKAIFAFGHQVGMNTILAIQSQHSPQPLPKPDSDKLIDEVIQALLQPREIEVEIVTETISEGLDEMAQPQYGKVPKLDSEGKLILKRVI